MSLQVGAVRLRGAVRHSGDRCRRRMPGKRALDVVLGSLLCLAALPIILILATVQAVTLRAFPFFVQERIGFGGTPQRFPKIRSLPKDTHPYTVKSSGTVATTPFSRVLRASKLDELPQLLLVPLGYLSLVGPRPKMPSKHEPACRAYVRWRVTVPQGCTGLWQISVDRHRMPHERPAYDLLYLRHSGVALDLWVLWRTFALAVGLQGAITIDDVPAWCHQGGYGTPSQRAELDAAIEAATVMSPLPISCVDVLPCAECASVLPEAHKSQTAQPAQPAAA